MEIWIWIGCTIVAALLTFLIFACALRWVEHVYGGPIDSTIELALGTALAVVALIATGIYVPHAIDEDNNQRQAESTCFGSVIALRKELAELRFGYQLAKNEANQRINDWDQLGLELENTKFGCQRAHPTGDGSINTLEDIADGFATAQADAMRNDLDAEYLSRIDSWSRAVLSQLQGTS